jgi:hypothetical protein
MYDENDENNNEYNDEEIVGEEVEKLENEDGELAEDQEGELAEDQEGELAEDQEGELAEEEESAEDEESLGLPFAKAEVVRLMKQNLDSDKMIRERVKIEMNNFLGEVLERVCEQLNEYPYTTIEYEMLKESIYPYKNIERINEEKKRILMHLEAIKADCDALSMDVKKSLRLKDVDEEEDDF